MSNFTKSIVYSGVVLAAGLVAIFAIYNNMSGQGPVSYIEPASGEEAILLDGQATDPLATAEGEAAIEAATQAEEATDAVAAATEASEGAADAAATAEQAADSATEAASNAEAAAEEATEAAEQATDAAEEAATEPSAGETPAEAPAAQ